jgi:ADP-ribose pyrophosphatase YjhB (NUDIX family)
MIWLLFENEAAVLLCRRKPGETPFAAYWTLPGDVMRLDESASETVKRFGRNELNVEITAEEFVDTFYLEEGRDSFAVTVFKPASFSGHLRYRESGPYAEAQWAVPAELPAPIHAALAEMLAGKRHWRSEDEPGTAGEQSA